VEALLAASAKAAQHPDSAPEALEHALRARDLSQSVNDTKLEALSLQSVAAAHAAAGALEACLQAADEALDLCLDMKDKVLEADVLLAMAGWQLDQGDVSRALADAEEAAESYQLAGSNKEIEALRMVFKCYAKLDNRRHALRLAKESVKRFEASGPKTALAEALDMLTSAYIAVDRLDEAQVAAERGVGLQQDLGNRRGEARLCSALAGLHLRMGRFDKALRAGEDAVLLYRESGGGTDEKTEALFNVVEAYIQKGDLRAALEAADEMKVHFQKESDVRGEAAVQMTLSQVYLKLDQKNEAISCATKAQVLLADSGSQLGEASALRLLSEVYSAKGDHKPAVRAAERSRTIFREHGERAEEASSLYVVAAESVAVAVAEGSRVGQPAPSRVATDALSKASKAAETVVKTGKELKDSMLVGCSLCIQAQVYMLNSKPEEALSSADEAVVLFRECNSAQSEANALLLSADASRFLRRNRDSEVAAKEALRLFRTLKPADPTGESNAQEILSYLDEIKKQQQQASQLKAAMAAQPTHMMPPPDMPSEMPEQAKHSPEKAMLERGPGAALDLSSGVDLETIRKKVTEIAARIVGAEEDELEMDTPLMEAGLTSNSALVLREHLTAELPGVSLPITLAFDYPSISAMAELIAESSGVALPG